MQGSKNQISVLRKNMIQHLANGRLDKIVENMSDKDYVNYCLAIFEYVMPRMNRVEMTGEDSNAIEIKIIRDSGNTSSNPAPGTADGFGGSQAV